MGLDYILDGAIMESVDRKVRDYCERFRGYDNSRLLQLRRDISPKGFLGFVGYFFSERTFQMDAINTVLEERGALN